MSILRFGGKRRTITGSAQRSASLERSGDPFKPYGNASSRANAFEARVRPTHSVGRFALGRIFRR